MRPGDVLGALTGELGYAREQVGKITVTDFTTYVAVARNIAHEAVRKLSVGKIKGKTVKVRAL
jgi:ATP-independent RNA helicase DbpA